MKSMTTAELMALEILKGNKLAARALADHLLDDTRLDAVRLPPVTKITTELSRLRVVLYTKASDINRVRLDRNELRAALHNWIYGDPHEGLVLVGIKRMELYELPAVEAGEPRAVPQSG